MNWETAGTILGVVGGLATGLTIFYKKAIIPMLKHYKNLQAIPEIQKHLVRQDDDMKNLHEQFKPNGGLSIRDLLDRVESNLVVMAQKQNIGLDSRDIAFMRTDSKGQIIEVTNPLCRMLERTEKEFFNHNWIATISATDRAEIQEEWQSAVGDHRNFEARFSFMTMKGEEVPVYMKMNPVPTSVGGEPRGYVGTITRTI